MKYLIQDIKPVKKVAKKIIPEESKYEPSQIFKREYRDSLKEKSSDFDLKDLKKVNGKQKTILWSLVTFSLIILLSAISSLFYGVTVFVDPKTKEVDLNEVLVAQKDLKDADFHFEIMELTGEESDSVVADTEKEIEERATGKVIVYNNYSPLIQKFAKDTRLEGSNGKIYKIEGVTSVPGVTTIDGQKVPGALEVNVYAENPGEEYNTGLIDFKVFGFKGTPKYDKFYGRSKTEITGGMKGKAYAVSTEKIATEEATVLKRLEENLFTKALAGVPENFVLLKGAYVLDVKENKQDFFSKDQNILIKKQGTMHIFLLKKDDLVKKLASAKLAPGDVGNVDIIDTKDLIVVLDEKVKSSLLEIKELPFTLKGKTTIIWNIDKAKIIEDILGKSKNEAKSILENYADVASYALKLRPFWKGTLPAEEKKVKIINKLVDL